MPRGGKREGAGRPKGKQNDATVVKQSLTPVQQTDLAALVASIVATLPPGYTSLDLVRAIYRHDQMPLDARMMAAIKALPFEHAKPRQQKGQGPQSISFNFGRYAKPA